MEIANLLALARKAARDIDENWLKKAKEMAIERYRRKGLQSFPTSDLIGSEDDPAVFELEALSKVKEVELKGGRKSKVIDVKVLNTSMPETVEKGEQYSLWFTTVLEKEMQENMPDVKEGDVFLLCYYGKYQKGKRPSPTDPHIFRVIPE